MATTPKQKYTGQKSLEENQNWSVNATAKSFSEGETVKGMRVS